MVQIGKKLLNNEFVKIDIGKIIVISKFNRNFCQKLVMHVDHSRVILPQSTFVYVESSITSWVNEMQGLAYTHGNCGSHFSLIEKTDHPLLIDRANNGRTLAQKFT